MTPRSTAIKFLRDVVTLEKGKPPIQQPYFGPGAERYLTPDYLRGKSEAEFVKPGINAVRARDDDTIVLWDGSNAGEVMRGRVGVLASTMTRVSHGPAFDRRYLFYAIQRWEFFLKGQTSGSGIPHVDKEIFRNLSIIEFDPPEQSGIAEVLSTVDREIELTLALIAKWRRVKTGLMADLLRLGIDEHGNLRSEQVHEFKDSPIGKIPVQWNVLHIGDLLADCDPAMRSGPFGSALLKSELSSVGIPLLGIDNVFAEHFHRDYRRLVPLDKARQLHRFLVKPNDIMITIMGTVGRCCVVPEDIGEALSSKHVWTISLNAKQYLPSLACYQINYSSWVLDHFKRDAQGGVMAAIKSATLRSTLLPVPPLPEQEEITAVLTGMNNEIDASTMKLAKLRLMRVGLRRDLLTGQRTITPLLTSGEVATV
jgi:type I restriction enzyme S subunit